MTAEPSTVTVEQVPLDVVLPLRSAVLRGGGPAGMPGDDDPATVHLAARTTAAGCYGRAGSTVVAGPYDEPGTGPHLGMLVELPQR